VTTFINFRLAKVIFK